MARIFNLEDCRKKLRIGMLAHGVHRAVPGEDVRVFSGELSPQLSGRLDLSDYEMGLKRCKNFYPNPKGAA